MRVIPLQSGSNGNSIYVSSRSVRLLFDAGVSGTQVRERLAQYGCSADNADALFISHDHADHVKCAGIYARKLGIPLHITERTLAVTRRRAQLGEVKDVNVFKAGHSVKIGHVTVETIQTPHDAVDGVVFVIDDGESRVGICTDVGHVYGDLRSLVGDVDGLYLESNYDEHMLETGPYPAILKRRIAGAGGHISNVDAAELVAKHAGSRLQWLCLAHLSEENNTPDLAYTAHRTLLGDNLPIHVARRYEVSDALETAPRAGGLVRRRTWQQLELFT